MPAEVLVMCAACGQPQPAGGARCMQCGAPLPDAPVPLPRGPFLSVDLGGGRSLVGEGGRLSYRTHAAGPPSVVELGSLRSLSLETRFFREALALVAFALLGFVAHSLALKAVAFGMAALGGVLAAGCRVHALVLETSAGVRLRWPLGLARRGSERDVRLLAAWDTLAGAVRARGLVVGGSGGSSSPPSTGTPPEGPRA